MKRLPSLPTLLLALVAGAGALGCSGMSDFLSGSGSSTPPVAQSPAERPASARADILASDASAQQLEDLTTALARLNATQAQLQVTLQDLQASAATQAEAARLSTMEIQVARREAVLAMVVAVTLSVVVLLLAAILIGQRVQMKRAARALARAEAGADTSPDSSSTQAAHVHAKDGQEGKDGKDGMTAPRRQPDGSNVARLRKRPPVG